MKWLFFKRTDDREVYIREDDIDYIVTYHKFAKIYLKNGKDQLVNNIGLGQRIMENESANLKEDLACASMDIQNKDDEIQDLKLENDRLQIRHDILIDYVRSASCQYCNKCQFKTENPGGPHCAYLRGPEGAEIMRQKAREIMSRLEGLEKL